MGTLIPNIVINTAHHFAKPNDRNVQKLENILNVVYPIMQQKRISKKHLAKLMRVSPTYIAQVFNGSKKLNMIFLAKLQMALDIEFKITAINC